MQLVEESDSGEAVCPRCSSTISPGIVARLPKHKKLCTLVQLLTTYKMDPVDLHADETAGNTVDHDGGYPVYAGATSDEIIISTVLEITFACPFASLRFSAPMAFHLHVP